MTEFRLKQTVSIISEPKIDGRVNNGKIVGIELSENGLYLGYRSKEEFLARFTLERYKVAYIDCFTQRAHASWHYGSELQSGAVKNEKTTTTNGR